MLRKIILLLWISLMAVNSGFALPYTNTSNAHLAGRITDKATGELLPGVSIYFPDLKTGTLTKPDGTYFIGKLPATRLLVQVRFVGYKMITELNDLTVNQSLDFNLDI